MISINIAKEKKKPIAPGCKSVCPKNLFLNICPRTSPTVSTRADKLEVERTRRGEQTLDTQTSCPKTGWNDGYRPFRATEAEEDSKLTSRRGVALSLSTPKGSGGIGGS